MRTLVLIEMVALLLVGCSSDEKAGRLSNQSNVYQPSVGRSIHKPNPGALVDDLGWLVGSWKVVNREFLGDKNSPDPFSLDELEYLNVYLPYADTNLTLKITGDPSDRPIAAEFIVKHVDTLGLRPRVRLMHMDPGGPSVGIGTNAIWIGVWQDHIPLQVTTMSYNLLTNIKPPQLELKSHNSKVILQKVREGNDILAQLTNSSVMAPVRDYSPRLKADLAHEYKQLKEEAKAAR